MVRIFVVGFYRSGTTLLQSLLGAHEMLAAFSESHLFSITLHPWRFYRPLYMRRSPVMPRVEVFLGENGLQVLRESDAVQWLHALDSQRWIGGVKLAKAVIGLFDQIAMHQGKSGWLEKTPLHLQYCDLITKVAPDTHFVHIACHGEDAVASLVATAPKWKIRWKNGDIYASSILSARCWNAALKRSLRYANHPQHHFVTYEALTDRTRSEVNRLVAELGLSSDPHLVDRYHDISRRVVLPEETWKAMNDQSIQKARLSTKFSMI